MLNNLTNFFNLIVGRKIKTATTIEGTDLIALGTKDSRFDGGYQPTAIEFDELKANIIASVPTGGVQSVTDAGAGVINVDNTDPLNPIVEYTGIFKDGTLTGTGQFGNPLSVVPQQAYTTVKDESTVLPQRSTMAFAGAGVTATDTGTTTVVTIPGGLSLAYEFTQDEGVTLPQRNTIDFQGAGVTATDNGSKTIVTIPGGGGGTVNYSDVFFVDPVNGNDATAAAGNFTKPYLWISNAVSAANASAPTSTNRALVYVRAGYYLDLGGSNIMYLKNYVDIYLEPGVVLDNGVVTDAGLPVECRVFGKAVFSNTVFSNSIFFSTGASNIYFEFDSIRARGAAFEFGGSTNVTVNGRYVYSETNTKAFGMTVRTSGKVIVNITEEYSAWHDNVSFTNFSGKFYMTCPRIYLDSGNIYGGDFKHVVICRNNLGGEATINGDLIVNSAAGYYGGNSGVIGRWTDSWMTLRLNGSIFAENQFGVYGLGSSTASRTIINGDVRSNHLIGYIASNSRVVFRNSTLMNWNNLVGVSEGYPVFSIAGSAQVWVENCHMYSLGTGATQPNIAAVWKDTTTSQLCINNTVHSGSDAIGFFVRNSVVGQPVNNVRIMNSRSTKPNDTNITDLLSPSGFVQDPNIIAVEFI